MSKQDRIIELIGETRRAFDKLAHAREAIKKIDDAVGSQSLMSECSSKQMQMIYHTMVQVRLEAQYTSALCADLSDRLHVLRYNPEGGTK